jgi:GAF domain-containing protein
MTREPETHEIDLTTAFIRLADTLVEDFDLLDALDALAGDCVQLLGITAAGLLLTGPDGALHVIAASSEQTRLLELVQLQRDQGPCLDCYRSGEVVSAIDLAAEAARWPLFAEAALAIGYRSVHAVPMRLRQQVIGALNLFSAEAGPLSAHGAGLAQALADMATITILQERAMRQSENVASQLQLALVSRVVLEQAKGMLAQRGGLSMEDAFQVLRKYARDRNLGLHDVSRGIIDGTVDSATVLESRKRRPQG